MPFAQVTEDQNGQKVLTPITESTSTTAADALALAENALALAEAALPKAGGEMTGDLGIRKSSPIITLAHNDIAREDDLESAHQSWLFMHDKNNKPLGGIAEFLGSDKNITYLRAYRQTEESALSDLSIVYEKEGATYATFPHPRPDNYGNDGVTAKAMKDWAAQNLLENKTYHVNPETGSDTADLNAGRGTADKPFKSVRGALSWVCTHHTGNRIVTIVLHGDCTEAGTTPIIPFYEVLITSDDTRRTLTIAETDSFGVGAGNMILRNININPGLRLVAQGNKGGGPSSITLDNVSLTGNIMQITANGSGAQIDAINEIDVNGAAAIGCGLFRSLNGATVDYSGATFTGSVTGWKYEARNGSLIIAGDKIVPGDGEGICDAHSVIA